MEENKNITPKIIIIFIIVLVISVILSVTFLFIQGIDDLSTSSLDTVINNNNQLIINNSYQLAPIGNGISSSTIDVYTNTWIDLNGVDELINLSYSGNKQTISFWFKNSTTDWTSIIYSQSDIYLNGILNTTFGYTPYEIDGDNIYIGYDGTDYYNLSIDSIRIYEYWLNSSDALSIYNLGRE